ncbi:hypothetical protein TPSD3_16935 [Thioflexithrix psekupsensis]|uniref:TerD domain-containing protein n=2 Tax=Thioflexithrix psekupsensis TaxID=1570016 RepID=A0A251X472_9GAMM|nr:hypothetical protein TPSD3_16935 [Thioflexithrix psekupsensis]
MQLFQQGEDVPLPNQPLNIALRWSGAADFDLAAAYQTHEDQRGLVYFGDLGKRDEFPYIRLTQDQGVGDKQGHYQEIIHISQFSTMKYIWFFCWDYHRAQNGEAARFTEGELSLHISNPQWQLDLFLPESPNSNVCCIALLDNTRMDEPRLLNLSVMGMLSGLKSLSQLLSLVDTEWVMQAA